MYVSNASSSVTTSCVRHDSVMVTSAHVKINYSVFKPGDLPSRDKLVILTGWAEDINNYEHIAKDLCQQGYETYVFDHRGQGASDRLSRKGYKGHIQSFQHYIDDFKELMSKVIQADESKPILVLAHSMGGLVASLFDLQHPRVIKAMALTAPMFKIKTKLLPSKIVYVIAKALDLVGFGKKVAPGQRKPKARQQNPNQVSEMTNRWVYQAMLFGRRFRRKASLSETPTLIVSAKEDRVVVSREHYKVSERKRNCDLQFVSNARHNILRGDSSAYEHTMSSIKSFFERYRAK